MPSSARRFVCLAVAFALSAGLAGCVAWGSTTARPPPDAPAGSLPPVGARLPLGLAIDFQGPGGRDLAGIRQVRLAAEAVFAASPVFLLTGRELAAHVLAVHLASTREERVWLTVLCILSGSLLPAVVSEQVDITAELRGPGGRVLGERKLGLSQTSMVQLFGLFGMPFAWESTVRGNLFQDVLRDLLGWAEEILESPEEAGPTPGTAPPLAPGAE
jgi:hypothetical protein